MLDFGLCHDILSNSIKISFVSMKEIYTTRKPACRKLCSRIFQKYV